MAESSEPKEAPATVQAGGSAGMDGGAEIQPEGRSPMDCLVNIKDPKGGTRAFQFTHRTTIFDALRQGISAALNVPLSAIHLNFEGQLTLGATVDGVDEDGSNSRDGDDTGGGASQSEPAGKGLQDSGVTQDGSGASIAAGNDGKQATSDADGGGGSKASTASGIESEAAKGEGDGTETGNKLGSEAGNKSGSGTGNAQVEGVLQTGKNLGSDTGKGQGERGLDTGKDSTLGQQGAGAGSTQPSAAVTGTEGAQGAKLGGGDGGSALKLQEAANAAARGSGSKSGASSGGDSKSGVSSARSSRADSKSGGSTSRGSKSGGAKVHLGAELSLAATPPPQPGLGSDKKALPDQENQKTSARSTEPSPGREGALKDLRQQLGSGLQPSPGAGQGPSTGLRSRRGSALYPQATPGQNNLVGEEDKLACFVQIQAVGDDSTGKKIQFTHRGSISDALKQGLSAALEVPKEDISLKFDGEAVPEEDVERMEGREGDSTTTKSRSSSGSGGSLRPRSSRGHVGGSTDGMDDDLRLDTGQLWNNEYSDGSDVEDEWRKQRTYSHLNWLWSLGSMDNPDHIRCLLRLARDKEHVTCDFGPLPQWILDDRRPEHYGPGGQFLEYGDGHFGAPFGESQLVIAEYLKKASAGKLAAKLIDKSTAKGVAKAAEKSEKELAQEDCKSKALIVRIHKGAGEFVARCVNIDRHDEGPPRYLGGYRDKRNGAIFLNREQQTMDEKPQPSEVVKFTRATQKYEMKRNFQNTIRESYTQMDRRDVLLNHCFDIVRIPGNYKDSVWWEWNRNRAAVIIQRYTRRLIAKHLAIQMRKDKEKMLEFFTEQERLEREDAKKALKHEIERRMQPETLADFDILYSELEAWRYQEVKKIHMLKLEKEEQIKAMQDLLYKETKLLQKITKMKRSASDKINKTYIAKKLTKMSTSKLWELTNGGVVHVTTPSTSRASDLMHLYFALAKDISSVDERMGVLGYIKWTVQEHSSDLCKEILMLIEREANFMYRGRPLKSLSALRQRILNLFLMFIETPIFNPEASMFQYVHTDFDGANLQSPTRRNRPGPIEIST